MKFKIIKQPEGKWNPTGINTAELNGVKYHWKSPTYKGDKAGWINENGEIIIDE